MEKKHHFTSDEKLKWFGYGEWVEEPDEALFVHEGIRCHVIRVVKPEMNGSKFGGHFCGYLEIPEGHPWHGQPSSQISCDVHGGITWTDFNESKEFWIGFDCGHSNDLIPSMDYNRKTIPELIQIQKEFEERIKQFKNTPCSWLFESSYKNLNYVIEECKSVAVQAKAARDLSLQQ